MRCSCGKPGTVALARRELPYCDACFSHLIASCARKEIAELGEEPLLLRKDASDPNGEYFLAAALEIAAHAKRQARVVRSDEPAVQACTPGCTETAAAATVRFVLGHTTNLPTVFPKTITLEELQRFFKADQPVILDDLTQELLAFDATYPGTTRSIAKYTEKP